VVEPSKSGIWCLCWVQMKFDFCLLSYYYDYHDVLVSLLSGIIFSSAFFLGSDWAIEWFETDQQFSSSDKSFLSVSFECFYHVFANS
jgi:Na+/H+ antiporter NhaA